MDRSKFIAGIAGPVVLALGFSIFVNRDLFPGLVQNIQSDPALVIVAGIVALAGGLAIVKTHNIWSGWPAIITLLGWLLVIGGLARIILPRQMAEIATHVMPNPALLLVPAALLVLGGTFLTYKGNS